MTKQLPPVTLKDRIAEYTNNIKYMFKINGFDVCIPIRKIPAVGTEYWAVFISTTEYAVKRIWESSDQDFRLLNRGLIHKTEEEAVAHAKALCSFTDF